MMGTYAHFFEVARASFIANALKKNMLRRVHLK